MSQPKMRCVLPMLNSYKTTRGSNLKIFHMTDDEDAILHTAWLLTTYEVQQYLRAGPWPFCTPAPPRALTPSAIHHSSLTNCHETFVHAISSHHLPQTRDFCIKFTSVFPLSYRQSKEYSIKHRQ